VQMPAYLYKKVWKSTTKLLSHKGPSLFVSSGLRVLVVKDS
jgi:hypothetical protein